jgi:hypothetical protein
MAFAIVSAAPAADARPARQRRPRRRFSLAVERLPVARWPEPTVEAFASDEQLATDLAAFIQALRDAPAEGARPLQAPTTTGEGRRSQAGTARSANDSRG